MPRDAHEIGFDTPFSDWMRSEASGEGNHEKARFVAERLEELVRVGATIDTVELTDRYAEINVRFTIGQALRYGYRTWDDIDHLLHQAGAPADAVGAAIDDAHALLTAEAIDREEARDAFVGTARHFPRLAVDALTRRTALRGLLRPVDLKPLLTHDVAAVRQAALFAVSELDERRPSDRSRAEAGPAPESRAARQP